MYVCMYVMKCLHTYTCTYVFAYVHSSLRTYIYASLLLPTYSLCFTVHRLVLFKNFHKCSVLVCGGDGSFGWVLATLDRLDMHDQVRACSETVRSTAPPCIVLGRCSYANCALPSVSLSFCFIVY